MGTTITKNERNAQKTDFPEFRMRLRQLRMENGLNLTQAAKKIGCSRKTYTHWETGKPSGADDIYSAPSLEYIIQIADAYGVSVDYLLGRVNAKNPDNYPVSMETGLTDEAIAGLQEIRKHDENEADVGLHNIPCMDLLNFMIKTDYMTRTLVHLRNFISPTYRFPVWRDENGNYVPASSLDEHLLHLSSVPDNVTPWNVHTIAITDQYLDSIEMRNVESMFHFMRDRWNDEHDTTKPRKQN